MVPRSHSRAITSAVSKAPIKVMMIATRPGTRKLRLRNSLLNQTRCSICTGISSLCPWAKATCSNHAPHTPST
ncbi:hypothetical protein GALL_396730 [mine drainage metagenome]|uniref:Uncharacterized protein n=1 Tax=mine drainage metagenome TaxID=410659 RepID=A0A1J5QRQ4_9ZZZZ